jgi:hypothetical protein
MYGFKFILRDLQRELLDAVQAEGIAFLVDPNGFLVVRSRDEHRRLERLYTSICKRALIAPWYFCSGSRDQVEKERAINAQRKVPYIEFECFGDDPQPYFHYCLAIRAESSLPKGQRPWDKK